MDGLTLLLSLIGGVSMGSYPVSVKNRSVVEANVHPLIFQCYKSFWVFASGFLFLIPHAYNGTPFRFTWWAVLSTAAWIPSGVCTIAAVPRIGVGMTVLVGAGTSSMLSFLVFWELFDENMKVHNFYGYSMSLAPFYLTCMIVGMSLLVFLGADSTPDSATDAELQELASFELYAEIACLSASAAPGLPAKPDGKNQFGIGRRKGLYTSHVSSDWIYGILMACCAGTLAALQASAVTFGRRHGMKGAGCVTILQCPPEVQERFNSYGSWMASFGIGAALVTSCMMLAMQIYSWKHSLQMPSFCLRTMMLPGSIAGILWCVGNFFNTLAITRGGNAVVVPACCSFSIITSGLWGLLYFKEVRGSDRICKWCCAAAFTLCSMLLLSHERS